MMPHMLREIRRWRGAGPQPMSCGEHAHERMNMGFVWETRGVVRKNSFRRENGSSPVALGDQEAMSASRGNAACGCYEAAQQARYVTASGEAQTFRVTHPFHPLRGRTFPLVDCRQTWGEDRVYFYVAVQLIVGSSGTTSVH